MTRPTPAEVDEALAASDAQTDRLWSWLPKVLAAEVRALREELAEAERDILRHREALDREVRFYKEGSGVLKDAQIENLRTVIACVETLCSTMETSWHTDSDIGEVVSAIRLALRGAP